MILLLGASGYIGRAFEKELKSRSWPFVPLSRKEVDYTQPRELFLFLERNKPDLIINAAGFTGKPNVDACEISKDQTLNGNVILPTSIDTITNIYYPQISWVHISSGCIYNGSKDGKGFTEEDKPNFCFESQPCSYYSGTKALAEQLLRQNTSSKCYIARLRIPFDEFNNSRNYLTKLQTYRKIYDNTNSLSHRADFVKTVLTLWRTKAPYGIYNITNPGSVTTKEVVEMIKSTLKPNRDFEYWLNDQEFYNQAAIAPRSNCILDTSKLESVGIKLRTVHEALHESLKNWKL